jgi:hypothetical protein
LPGDFNRDGRVDAADYTVWRDQQGATGMEPYAAGDADGNGIVNQTDYALWRRDFGRTLASPLAPVASAVPEPTTLALLLALLAVWCGAQKAER